MLLITAIILILGSCRQDDSSSIDTTLSRDKSEPSLFQKPNKAQNILTIDTTHLVYLEEPIILKLPIAVDTSYIISDMCGNAPRCKKYSAYQDSVSIEICQHSWPSMNSVEEQKENNYNKENDDHIKELKKIYVHEVDHKVLDHQMSTGLGEWKISGLAILSEREGNTIKLSCFNSRQVLDANGDYDVFTTIFINCTKTMKSTEEITDWTTFICHNLNV